MKMTDEASVRMREQDGVSIVSFEGVPVLDVLTIQRIAKDVYGFVEGGEERKLVLDFTDVRFLSSQALGVMLTLRRKADKAGAKVAVARIRPELHRVFEVTNLDKLFDFCPSLEDAIARVKGE